MRLVQANNLPCSEIYSAEEACNTFTKLGWLALAIDGSACLREVRQVLFDKPQYISARQHE